MPMNINEFSVHLKSC